LNCPELIDGLLDIGAWEMLWEIRANTVFSMRLFVLACAQIMSDSAPERIADIISVGVKQDVVPLVKRDRVQAVHAASSAFIAGGADLNALYELVLTSARTETSAIACAAIVGRMLPFASPELAERLVEWLETCTLESRERFKSFGFLSKASPDIRAALFGRVLGFLARAGHI
jgi:hypothetical protein